MILRDDQKRLFQFTPDPAQERDKSGSTHVAIAEVGLALASLVSQHIPDLEAREATVRDLAASVRRAHVAVVGLPVPAAEVAALEAPVADEPPAEMPVPEPEPAEPVALDVEPEPERKPKGKKAKAADADTSAEA